MGATTIERIASELSKEAAEWLLEDECGDEHETVMPVIWGWSTWMEEEDEERDIRGITDERWSWLKADREEMIQGTLSYIEEHCPRG